MSLCKVAEQSDAAKCMDQKPLLKFEFSQECKDTRCPRFMDFMGKQKIWDFQKKNTLRPVGPTIFHLCTIVSFFHFLTNFIYCYLNYL